jgi:hypothetical protein
MLRAIYRASLGVLPDGVSLPIRRAVGTTCRLLKPAASAPPVSAQPEPVRFDGEHSKRWWATRDDGETSSAQGYWDQRHHPLRQEIGKTLSSLGAASLLEVGCHAGMNLWSAAQFQSWQRIAGVELSNTVLDFARQTLSPALGFCVELTQASADNLPFADKSFDVTLTAGTLVCIGPDDIEKSLSEICRVSRRWIVLVEPIEIDQRFATAAGREDPYPNTMYWIRDYSGLLEGSAVLRSLTPMRRNAQLGHLNSIAVFELAA